jgi:hypothetical protein
MTMTAKSTNQNIKMTGAPMRRHRPRLAAIVAAALAAASSLLSSPEDREEGVHTS